MLWNKALAIKKSSIYTIIHVCSVESRIEEISSLKLVNTKKSWFQNILTSFHQFSHKHSRVMYVCIFMSTLEVNQTIASRSPWHVIIIPEKHYNHAFGSYQLVITLDLAILLSTYHLLPITEESMALQGVIHSILTNEGADFTVLLVMRAECYPVHWHVQNKSSVWKFNNFHSSWGYVHWDCYQLVTSRLSIY